MLGLKRAGGTDSQPNHLERERRSGPPSKWNPCAHGFDVPTIRKVPTPLPARRNEG
jgi:hypothetical protein